HAAPETPVNTMFLEAYNAVWNYRAKQRSKHIEPRQRLDDTLAPAFWPSSRFDHIVPDWDDATMDGHVALNVVGGQLPVKGLGISSGHVFVEGTARETGGSAGTPGMWTSGSSIDGKKQVKAKEDPDNPGYPAIFAEMQADGITISL